MSEHDRELEHEYDGIREYDNPMPGWWKATFVATIVFAVAYALWLHGGPMLGFDWGGKTIQEEFAAELAEGQQLAAARALKEVKEADLLPLLQDQTAIHAGQTRYLATCAPCHGDKAEGKIGPNLTDEHWIHGKGTLADIYKVVTDGVPEKGMPTWGKQLKPDEIKQLVAFLGTVRNTHVPGKAPQGLKVAVGMPTAGQVMP